MKHSQRDCPGVPELKQHYLFRERTGNDPLVDDYSFQQHESPGLFFRIYRGRKSCRELRKLDWLAAKDSPGCAAVFEKFIAQRVSRV